MPDSASNVPNIPPSPQSLVNLLKAQPGLLDARLESAFLHIPRAAFLPDLPVERVYIDEAIPVKRDSAGVISSSSQPGMMAIMLRQLHLKPGFNVLEIGTGTGYNAALIHHLVGEAGRVTTVELDPQVAEAARANLQRIGIGDQVMVVTADGAGGYPPRAQYDRIIATAGVWDIPRAWVKQLKARGIIVAPLGLHGAQYSAEFHLQPDGTLFSESNAPCGFIRLRGTAARGDGGAGASRTQGARVGSTSLVLQSDIRIDAAALHLLLSDDADKGYLGGAITPSDWVNGITPYLHIHLPDHVIFALYSIPEGGQAYGIEGMGLALLSQGSAVFAPRNGQGLTYTFGGADMTLLLQELTGRWHDAGQPRIEAMRLRLTPKVKGTASIPSGSARKRIIARQEHNIEIWLER